VQRTTRSLHLTDAGEHPLDPLSRRCVPQPRWLAN
jgi:hypothetical protein